MWVNVKLFTLCYVYAILCDTNNRWNRCRWKMTWNWFKHSSLQILYKTSTLQIVYMYVRMYVCMYLCKAASVWFVWKLENLLLYLNYNYLVDIPYFNHTCLAGAQIKWLIQIFINNFFMYIILKRYTFIFKFVYKSCIRCLVKLNFYDREHRRINSKTWVFCKSFNLKISIEWRDKANINT